MYPKVQTKIIYVIANYFAWAGGFLIGRSEQSSTSRAPPSLGWGGGGGGGTWAHPRTAAGYRAYVVGGYSKEASDRVRNLLGPLKGRDVLMKMQKAVLSSSLNIARTLKLCVEH